MNSVNSVNSDEVSKPLFEKNELPKSPPLPFYNTEDYWSIWIGFGWFLIIIGTTYANLKTARVFEWKDWESLVVSLSYDNLSGLLLIFSGIMFCLYLIQSCMDKKNSTPQYFILNIVVFGSKFIGGFHYFKLAGIGDSVWAIIIGVIIRLMFKDRCRKYFSTCLSMEFFIKASIVLLAINIKEIAHHGLRGMIVSWVETITLLIIFYFIGTKILVMPSDESLITTGAFSICGSSAALSLSDCIKADKKISESIIIFMSIFTVPFIPLVPYVGKLFDFNSDLIGAWIGGSVDSTGAVSASASLAGLHVTHIAIIIKMLQNILIGPVCLVVSLIKMGSFKPLVLWQKFPKFVLGFLVVAIITSVLPEDKGILLVANVFIISEWFSCISFVLIGMEIELFKFSDLIIKRWKMLLLYLIGQSVDTFTTLGVAYLVY